ncbi:MAG: phosphomannomutase, partial [Propionibacterium sp.]
MQASLAAARAWLKDDPDEQTRAQLTKLLADAESGATEAIAELQNAFAGPLQFGTAGLRGPLGPGPARMNRVVVTRAAAGFAAWLTQQGAAGGKVIIGYDARYNSDVFARDTAEVFAAAGFQPLLIVEPTPTPVIAFGIGHYGCVAGIVVTASHNPPLDNGYKVYLGDGSQIAPPTDVEIAAEIARASESRLSEIPRSTSYETGYNELIRAYIGRAKTLVADDAPREIKWVYSAMHGVGGKIVDQAADAAGFPVGIPVASQQQPDPAFPTVSFPNPEEPGAIDLALALARQNDADLV